MKFHQMFGRLVILLSLTLCAHVSYASDSLMAEAINTAGMQRMLSQRIAKSYFMKGLGENSASATRQLDESILRFEQNITDLEFFVKKNRLETALPELTEKWKDYKKLVSSPTTKASGKAVLQQSDLLLNDAHELTQQIQLFSGIKTAELVNISGRQRMLAQRISKLYMAYCWNLQGEESLESMMESLSEYEVALEFLRQSPNNSKQVKHQLRKVSGQLKFAQKSFDKLNEGSYLIHVVNSTTDTMLKQMDKVTELYIGIMSGNQSLVAR